MVNNLLYYSCYIASTFFDATAPSSGNSCPELAKLHNHLNAEQEPPNDGAAATKNIGAQ
jgi:hypothetical protein